MDQQRPAEIMAEWRDINRSRVLVFIELQKQGMSVRQIGKLFYISGQRVYQLIKKYREDHGEPAGEDQAEEPEV